MSASALTVRWSLVGAPEGVEQELRDYVAETSHARFEQREGLRFKTWRMRSGEWFEGCYVFVDDAARSGLPGVVHRDGSRVARFADHRLVAGAHRGVRGRRDRQGPDGFVSAPSYDG